MTEPLPAVVWDPEELAYVIEPWAHANDAHRVRTETWPFRWGHPAPGTTKYGPPARHPLDSPGPERPPAMVAARRRPQECRDRAAAHRAAVNAETRRHIYDVQIGIYAQAAGRGLRPDLILTDEIGEEPAVLDVVGSVPEIGTAFHRLMEALGMQRRDR